MKTISTDGQFITSGFSLSFLVAPPASVGPVKKAIVLLHGVGGNETNLFSFAHLLPDYTVICPRAPYEMRPGSYGWFNVDFSRGFPVIDPEQEAVSRAGLELFVDEIREKYTLGEIMVGGFSQGAIMAYSLGLLHPEKVSAVFAFSGRILPEIKPFVVSGSPALKNLRVSVSHGRYDNKLEIGYAREAREYLLSIGVKLNYREFETGHQLTEQMFSAACFSDQA